MSSKILIKINNQSVIYNKEFVTNEFNENKITLTKEKLKN